jgi:membrane fusion protein (multidrug efflux system)
VTDTVNRVHFEDGDHVEGGQILVEMTNNEESALLAEAQANLNEARRQLTRQLDLGEKGLAAKSTVDEAIAREGAAEARFNAITARMNDRLIRAPFGGILGFREISPGTMLTSNTVITTLDDISIIKLDFSIPELYLGVVETGFRIISKSDVWKDREFEGEINSIGSRIDPVTRAVTVRAAIRNEEELLRPGMLMTVRIITDVRQALVIPESAFIQTGDESFVFVAGLDGLAHRRVIQIGARRFGFVEILEGLSAGERVITEGGFKLQDKAPYKVEDKSGINLSLEATAIRPGSI